MCVHCLILVGSLSAAMPELFLGFPTIRNWEWALQGWSSSSYTFASSLLLPFWILCLQHEIKSFSFSWGHFYKKRKSRVKKKEGKTPELLHLELQPPFSFLLPPFSFDDLLDWARSNSLFVLMLIYSITRCDLPTGKVTHFGYFENCLIRYWNSR